MFDSILFDVLNLIIRKKKPYTYENKQKADENNHILPEL